MKFRQINNRCKKVPESAKLTYANNANKTKKSITSQKLASSNFWRIATSILNKGNAAIPPLFNGPEVMSSASDKTKVFAKCFFKSSNLDFSCISLPAFSSRTNLKMHNIYVIPKLVKNFINNLRVVVLNKV